MVEIKKNDTTLVNFRVDPIVKESAEAVLAGMGLNMSSYVGMCLRQLAQERKVPFTPTVDAKFWMAEAKISEAMEMISSKHFMFANMIAEGIISGLDELFSAHITNRYILQYRGAFAGVQSLETALSMIDLAKTATAQYTPEVSPAHIEYSEADRDEAVAVFEEMREMVVKSARGMLTSELWEDEGYDDTTSPDIEVVRAIDEYRFAPVEVYEKYGENFALRFANGGSVKSYDSVVELSEKIAHGDKVRAKWVEEDKQKIEAHNQRMMELLQAIVGKE